MKTTKILFLGLGLCAGLAACSDFDEVNTDPKAVGAEFVKPQYALNNSIGTAQMDPGVGERTVVYNWASASRVCGEMSFLSVGRYNDDYTSSYYYPNISNSIKHATLAITSADEQMTISSSTEHEKKFFPNVKQFARIWRAYLISEFIDNFGPYPLDSFQGKNPVFNAQKDCYLFILKELKEATNAIDESVTATDDEGKCDPFDNVKYNPVKWKKFGNSLRMRLAMRLSKAEPGTAQAEFEDAVKGNNILTADDMFSVKENDGWNNFTGIYAFSYDDQVLSSTISNLLTNLGSIPVKTLRPDLESYVKEADYLGIKYNRHYVGDTDNPTKQYWLDGLPANLDPRALKIFCLPDDSNADNYIDKYTEKTAKSFALLAVTANGEPIQDGTQQARIKIDATCCWNGYPAGSSSAWSPTISRNELLTAGEGPASTMPILGKDYCEGKSRIFFASWETYFLIAEAALYHWNVEGMTAKAAYENGVKASFEYFGVTEYVDAYLQSTDYNRVGTSVKFDDTMEPQNTQMKYIDGYDAAKTVKVVTYQYPDATKNLYAGKKLNDQLTKVITQKFIAQTPYLALEMWSDFRRLGLPYFEISANESIMTGSDMVNVWTKDSWKSGQKWDFYPQRMRYPTSLDNADPEGYSKAVELLDGKDVIITPLWWAKH